MERAVFEVKQVAFNREAAAAGDLSHFAAEEYLAWVVHEASTLPDVVSVQIPSQELATETKECKMTVPEQHSERSDLMPALSWERDFMHRFSSLTKVIPTPLYLMNLLNYPLRAVC